MVASRGAATDYGACPDCLIVAVQTPSVSTVLPTVTLYAHCERGHRVDCDPPILDDLGFGCAYIPPPVVVDVADGYAEQGDEISWTLVFDGDLADYASMHRHGEVLRSSTAEAAPVVAGSRLLLASCTRTSHEPWRCRSQTGNWVLNSRDYVVGS